MLPLQTEKKVSTKIQKTDSRLDRIGAFASFACAIHCLAAPIVLILLPSFAPIWTDPAAHIMLAVLVVPLAIISLSFGYRQHRRLPIPLVAGVGLVLIIGGMAAPAVAASSLPSNAAVETTLNSADCSADCCAKVTIEEGEVNVAFSFNTIITIIGSIFLALSHLWNLRLCSKLKCCGQGCATA